MQALLFRSPGEWGLEHVPVPRVEADDDVLLRVDRASICGTDIHILSVPPGHPATPGSILGHEYAGTVMETGAGVRELQAGDRVVIDPNLTCGLCRYCRQGMSNMCENMTTLGIFRHGGLAEYNVAPARALHRIGREVPAEQATLAEPLSCVYNAFERAPILPGESVAVLGAGPIGLMFLMLYRAAGAGRIVVVEPVEFRRKMARECGADEALEPRAAEIPGGADVVVDATGTLLPEALSCVRRGGRVVLFGMNQHGTRPVNQYCITRFEITIIGTYIQRTAFPKVVKILESGLLPLDKLITHRLALGQVGEGLAAMRAGEAVKVVVAP